MESYFYTNKIGWTSHYKGENGIIQIIRIPAAYEIYQGCPLEIFKGWLEYLDSQIVKVTVLERPERKTVTAEYLLVPCPDFNYYLVYPEDSSIYCKCSEFKIRFNKGIPGIIPNFNQDMISLAARLIQGKLRRGEF